ncbi:aminoacyl-tRNA hydrolase [Thermosipho ferrireducens]|uniref:Peptidyl-tRNA hydrolase n=1 Tax=Thermosipho ferrireducens TaxID=2571116 RepID=A0ABX7S7R2_9BACT|nr:aminoacyl-tRNA hydrolase [Thermosipho ferrireducens]QTA37321.1 aminoacyl-tRNA hydrolase [Thermosipho ferrireducens]
MVLVVGLGNPGPHYAFTRHNVGFMFLDRLSSHWQREFNYLYSKIKIEDKDVKLVKPMTYMNLSGKIFDFIKIENYSGIIVVYDDLDLPLGKIRIRKKGSAGGHNGVKSIIHAIGEKFIRIRIGIGPKPEKEDVVHYVLSNFTDEELQILDKVLNVSIEALRVIISESVDKAMNKYNSFEVAK